MRQDESTFQRDFSSVLRPRLLAVEARRRRYRIEKVLGYLPEMPKELPEPVSLEPRAVVGTSPALEAIRVSQEHTEVARQRLTKLRRPPTTADTAELTPHGSEVAAAPPSPEPAEPVALAQAAFEYFQQAQEWYRQAEAYRSGDTEQAVAIRQAAARSLADAAAEIRRERVASGQAEAHPSAGQPTPDAGAAPIPTPLRSAEGSAAPAPWTVDELFWQVLAWEREAKKCLETVGTFEEERRRLAEEADQLSRCRQEQGGH